jgi:hypothetical protein
MGPRMRQRCEAGAHASLPPFPPPSLPPPSFPPSLRPSFPSTYHHLHFILAGRDHTSASHAPWSRGDRYLTLPLPPPSLPPSHPFLPPPLPPSLPPSLRLGLLASIGLSNSIPVHPRPTVGILSSGDELVEAGAEGGREGGGVWDSNRPALLALFYQLVGKENVIDLGIVR